MDRVYITKIHIEKVRHLKNIDIPLTDESGKMKHLILTGKNGSGKTSLLEALRGYLNSVSTSNDPHESLSKLIQDEQNLKHQQQNGSTENELYDTQKRIDFWNKRVEKARNGLLMTFNVNENELKTDFEKSKYILAYFDAKRSFHADEPKAIEKVKVKDHYAIDETPRQQFLKYMLDLKMTQALAISGGKTEKAEELQKWFDKIQQILRDIYEDPNLTLDFDEDTYQFIIHEKDREPFDFNTASDGFSAILDIVVGLILRMQEPNRRVTEFTKPGIVLIDEIENHLHLALQKKILDYLTNLFPNVQFIVTTHSPFVVNSLDNADIFDLENQKPVFDNLSNVE